MLCLAALVASTGCDGDEAVQLMVTVVDGTEDGLRVPGELDAFGVEVSTVEPGAGRSTLVRWERVVALAPTDGSTKPGSVTLPQTLAVVPAERGSSGTVRVEVTGLRGGALRQEIVRTSGFGVGRVDLPPFVLTRQCFGVECPEGQSCEADGRCHGTGMVDAGPVGRGTDGDGDGHPTETDCDDSDPEIHPDALETCNGEDDDCDGRVDPPESEDARTFFEDGDGDGYGRSDTMVRACDRPEGFASEAGDCDDGDGDVSPGASESCGGDRDRDCDGEPGCADDECEEQSCGGGDLCFGGVCASPCDTHNDGSVSCSTLCGWCRGSCRGAITDDGRSVPCSHDGDPMWCYCEF